MFTLFFAAIIIHQPAWQLVDSGVDTPVRGLSAVDSRVCWFGTKTGVGRTVGGGKTWRLTFQNKEPKAAGAKGQLGRARIVTGE